MAVTVRHTGSRGSRGGPNGRGKRGGAAEVDRGRVAQIQRSRILAAVVDVVGAEGFARFTVEHVVARAGVSRRTFYQEFDDREDCFRAAFEDAAARVSTVVVGGFEQERQRGWRAGLRGGLTALLRFLEDEPGLAGLLVVDALAAGPDVLESRTGLLAGLARVVDHGRDQPRGRRPPALTGEGVVGAVFSVIHARLLARDPAPLSELVAPLMSMIVLPYLGPAAAAKELTLPLPDVPRAPNRAGNPYEGLNMRLTYRTFRVLEVIGEQPGQSNREVAEAAGITDQGQVSKLLVRLEHLGLIHNHGDRHDKGAPNAWTLTARGRQLQQPQAGSNADTEP
jgi:AcrR family transcriptional regulator